MWGLGPTVDRNFILVVLGHNPIFYLTINYTNFLSFPSFGA